MGRGAAVMAALWLMVPAKYKLYALIIIVVLLAFVGYRNRLMAAAVTKYALEVSNADEKRATDIRARVRDRVRSDEDGYRD